MGAQDPSFFVRLHYTMAMKGMRKAMRAMKKKKRVSVIAKGKFSRALVFRGSKTKTQSGLTKDKLMRNKAGKIVSKAASASGKKRFLTSGLKKWADAVKAARKELKCKGFVAVGGTSPAGKALYLKAKSLLKA